MGGLGGVTVATTRFGGRVADQLSSVEALAQKGKKKETLIYPPPHISRPSNILYCKRQTFVT